MNHCHITKIILFSIRDTARGKLVVTISPLLPNEEWAVSLPTRTQADLNDLAENNSERIDAMVDDHAITLMTNLFLSRCGDNKEAFRSEMT